jgi:hypothetical protein
MPTCTIAPEKIAKAKRRRRRLVKSRPVARALAARNGGAEPAQARAALTARIQAAVEREIEAVERLLTALGASEPAETEGTARTLASLARTLRELVHLDTSPPEPVDEQPPRDLDELRRALAQRLDELIAEAKTVSPDEGGESGP